RGTPSALSTRAAPSLSVPDPRRSLGSAALRGLVEEGAPHAQAPAAAHLDQLVLVAPRGLHARPGRAGDGEHVGLGAGALAVAAHDDVGGVVAHEEPEALDALAEAAYALAALVDAHQAPEVEAAVVGEEARELLPAAEVARVAVGRDDLADGDAVVGRELAHDNSLLPGTLVRATINTAGVDASSLKRFHQPAYCGPLMESRWSDREAAEFVERLAPR